MSTPSRKLDFNTESPTQSRPSQRKRGGSMRRSVSQPTADIYKFKLQEIQARIDESGGDKDDLRDKDLLYSVELGKEMLNDLKVCHTMVPLFVV